MADKSDFEQLATLLNTLNEEFDTRSFERHAVVGKEEYGQFKFLEVDTLEMAIEEVLDLANYARYTYVKLRILQDFIAHKAAEAEKDTTGASFIETRKML